MVGELKKAHPQEDELKEALKDWKKTHPIPRGTVHTVVDHIDHLVRIMRIDHVGLGPDYDGAGTTPVQLQDVSGYPYITQGLLNRGYPEEQIRKIMGANLLRAMRLVEKVAREWED